jgi:glycosyltransferase involved in cell wall biosynthesis
MTKISIIIPTLNEVDAIHRLLLYVKKELSKTIPFELIVVDGGSTDGTQNKVQSLH